MYQTICRIVLIGCSSIALGQADGATRLMTMNFQSTGGVMREQFSKTFDMSASAIKQLVDKRDVLSRFVEGRRNAVDAQLAQAKRKLEEKKKELGSAYEQQKNIVNKQKQIVAQLEERKKREYDPIKMRIDKLMADLEPLKKSVEKITEAYKDAPLVKKPALLIKKKMQEGLYKTAIAPLTVAAKALDKVAYIQSKFSQENAKFAAEQARLAALMIGGSLYASTIHPFTKAVEEIEDKGLAKIQTVPEHIQLVELTHKIDIVRRELAIEMIKQYKPDIICFQENNADKHIFVGRLTGYNLIDPQALAQRFKTKKSDTADWNPILYNVQRYEIVQSGVMWMNPNNQPFTPGWGAKGRRTCTWAHVKDKKMNVSFWIYNTHLDHKVEKARAQGIQLIARTMKQQAQNEVAFLIGDLNIFQLDKEAPFIFLPPFNLKNAREIAKEVVHDLVTFVPTDWEGGWLDYFLVYNSQRADILRYDVIDYKRGGLMPSDHRAIILDVRVVS